MRLCRRLAPVLVAVGAAVLTAGCMDTVVDLTINDDGSGTQRVDLRVRRDYLDLMAETALSFAAEQDVAGVGGAALDALTDAEVEELCRSLLLSDSPVGRMSEAASRLGAAVESNLAPVVESDVYTCRVTMVVDWDSDAAGVVQELSAAVGAESSLQRRAEGGWRFESDTAFAGEEWTGETLFYLGLLDERDIPRPTVALSVTLPGDLSTHNSLQNLAEDWSADNPVRFTGSTVVWNIRDVFDPEPRIFVETVRRAEPSSWVWVYVVAVVVALAALALLPWWFRRLPRVLQDNLTADPPGGSVAEDFQPRDTPPARSQRGEPP